MGDTWPISDLGRNRPGPSMAWEGTDPPSIHQPLGKTLNQEENEASTLSIWSTDKAQLISQFSQIRG